MTSRHSRELENEASRLREEIARERDESARLRAENRALLNSILGIAGIPPVLVEENAAPAPGEPPTAESAEIKSSSASGRPRAPRSGKGTPVAPARRRSWHQITQSLELASARRERPDAPAPRA